MQAKLVFYILLFWFGVAFANPEVEVFETGTKSCKIKMTDFSGFNFTQNSVSAKFKSTIQPSVINNCSFVMIGKKRGELTIYGGFISSKSCTSKDCTIIISANPTQPKIDTAKATQNPPKKELIKTTQSRVNLAFLEKKSTTEQLSIKQRNKGKLLVVIDAGHGGKDPGAIASSKVKEKQITLAYANYIKKVLEASGYDVYLTRNSDTYIELYSRIDVAMQKKADIFISIHADAAKNKEARGATIYALSGNELNNASLKAQQRGKIAGNFSVKSSDKDLLFNILNIQHSSNVKQSFEFAEILKNNMQKRGIRFTSSPVRSANFAVLKAPTFPAILLEIGYISNKDDYKLLVSRNYMDAIAQSIKKSLDDIK
jgi:N-acetylmuramoyl-L-alanine amidase